MTGVFKNYPSNSHLKFSVLVSYPTYSQVIGSYGNPNDVLETSFGWTDFYTYILLRKGTDPKRLAAKLPGFIDRHYNNLPENKSQSDSYSLSLMPLKDIHLYSHYTEEAEANGDGQSVTFLFLIAFFIICIAWINYINLATARSLERAREVGVRKVLGALRGELIGQFMLESLLLNLIALLAAVIITMAITPLFAHLSGRPLPSLLNLPSDYKQYFLVLLVAGIFLSGIYPALGSFPLYAGHRAERHFQKCSRRAVAAKRINRRAICRFHYPDRRNNDCLSPDALYAKPGSGCEY